MKKVTSTSEIQVTEDYSSLRFHPANRKVRESSIRGMVRNMERKFLLASFPIVVNKQNEIMDGQTRFKAAQRLGKPIFYIVDPRITIEDVAEINKGVNWKGVDHIYSNAKLGHPIAQELVARAEIIGELGFKFGDAAWISGVFRMKKDVPERINTRTEFLALVEKIEELYLNFGHKKMNHLTRAFLFVVKHPKYDHQRMVNKIKKYGNEFRSRARGADNIMELERIYNFNVASSDEYVVLHLSK